MRGFFDDYTSIVEAKSYPRAIALMAVGVWFVLFSSKFVFIWAIDLVVVRLGATPPNRTQASSMEVGRER